MRRYLGGMLALLVAVVAVAGQGATAGAQAPSIYVSPGAGTEFDTFVFEGYGFAPYVELEEHFIAPNGELWSFFDGSTQLVVVTDENGSFRVTVLPNTDFAGAPFGRWEARFRPVGSPDYWSVTFDILP
jgi:hypothetical protein